MISCACGRRSIGKTCANRSGSSSQPPTICGVSDDVAQVSMHVGVADEAAGLAALGLGEAGGHVGRRVDRQRDSGGEDRLVVVRLAVGVERGTTPGTARRRTAGG